MFQSGDYLKVDIDNVSWERLAGEIIAIQLATGHYYSISGPASDVWSLLSNGINLETLKVELGRYYDFLNDPEIELRHFLENLFSTHLIIKTEIQDLHTFESLPEDFERLEWIAPLLHEYTDLQDLILVDPVHDTKASGWPELKEE